MRRGHGEDPLTRRSPMLEGSGREGNQGGDCWGEESEEPPISPSFPRRVSALMRASRRKALERDR